MARLAAALPWLAAATTGLAQTPAPAPTPPRAATFIATEYAWQGPAVVPPGPVTLRMVNRGRETHQGQLARIVGRHTSQEALTALRAGRRVDWLLAWGGFGAVAPGETARLAVELPPGPYLIYCAHPDADGRIHGDRGMVTGFTVGGPAVSAGHAGSIAAVLAIADLTGFRFQRTLRVRGEELPIEARHLGYPLAAGDRAIEIENLGPSTHQVQLLRSDSMPSLRGFTDWLEGGQRGPAPARALGGVGAMPPGMKLRMPVTLTPGIYWLYCPTRHRRGVRGYEVGELVQFVVR